MRARGREGIQGRLGRGRRARQGWGRGRQGIGRD